MLRPANNKLEIMNKMWHRKMKYVKMLRPLCTSRGLLQLKII